MEKIILYNIEGSARLSGTDANGCTWVQFEVDYLAEQQPGECVICGEELESGWHCLAYSGDEVCDNHIMFAEDL